VVDIERDFRRAKQGENLIYTTLLGLKPNLTTPRIVTEILEKADIVECEIKEVTGEHETENLDEESESETEESCSDSEATDDSEDENNNLSVNSSIHVRPRDESPNSRKVFDKRFADFLDS